MLKLDSLAPRIPPGGFGNTRVAIVSVGVALVMTNSLERYYHAPNAIFFLSYNSQRMVRQNGAGIACGRAFHAGRRLLLRAGGCLARGSERRRPALVSFFSRCQASSLVG